MTPQPHKQPVDAETDVWNAISTFEKILEAFPNDRVALETLADAYDKIGDHIHAKDYLIRLASVLLDEDEEDAANEAIRKLKEAYPDDPEAKKMIARLKGRKPTKVMAEVLEGEEGETRRPISIADEMAFAWNLMQSKKLTQDEYAKVVHDLSENTTKTNTVPISTLHVLHDMNFPNINTLIAFIAVDSKIPFISLSNFECQLEVAELLPIDFIIKRGAIIFELMGHDALVAVLNPNDTKLPHDIETLTGKPCHLFLVTPPDFDNALEKIRKLSETSP